MSAIVWDKTGSREYELGVDRGVLYTQKTDGSGTYDNGVAWNGLSSVTESPSGAEETVLYADNIKYASLRADEDFGLTIEAYMYPDEFAACDGSVEVSPGVYIGQQKRVPFGLAYRTKIGSDTDSDKGYKLHLVYNATVSPSETAYESVNDNPDAIIMSWGAATTPVNTGDYKPSARITINSTKADKAKLAELEKKLYGDETNEPTLPSLKEVIGMFPKTGATE